MSQNKTVFPGMGPEGDFNRHQSAAHRQPYSRPAANSGHKGTVFPGIEAHADITRNDDYHPHDTRPAGKPIVGFLYSISRTGVGEFWPLHIGQNIIGTSPDCDIVLAEGTVSQRHANLHINKMKKPEKTEATISELGSTNGTLVNDNSVSVARPVECVNGDIITVGHNYELLLLLIDAKALGLHVATEFYETESPDDIPGPAYPADPTSTRLHDFPPHFAGPSGTVPTSDSTVGIDNTGGYSSGGTVGMD